MSSIGSAKKLRLQVARRAHIWECGWRTRHRVMQANGPAVAPGATGSTSENNNFKGLKLQVGPVY